MEGLVLGRYEISTPPQKLGEGSFCICYKGTDVQTKATVAIKVYKLDKDASKQTEAVAQLKFKRQIEVLKELMAPVDKAWAQKNGLFFFVAVAV